eukprot:457956-Pyramimonas_sp.AAC.1
MASGRRTRRDPPMFRWTPAHRSLEELVGTEPQELRDWLGNGWADYFARAAVRPLTHWLGRWPRR